MRYLMRFFSLAQTLVLAVLVFCVLVFSWGGTFQGEMFEKFVIFTGLFVLGIFFWFLSGISQRGVSVGITSIHWFLAGFVAMCFLSAVFSVDRYRSIWGIFSDPFLGSVGFLLLALFFGWIVSCPARYTLTSAILGYMGGATILAGLVVGNIFFGTEETFLYMGLPKSGATVQLIFLINVLVFLWALSRRDTPGYLWWKIFQKGVTVFLFLGLLITVVAFGIVFNPLIELSFLFGIGIPTLFLMARRTRISRKGIVALVFCVGVFFAFTFFREFFDTSTHQFALQDSSVVTMGISREIFFASMAEHSILGYGLGTYAQAYDKYLPAYANDQGFFGVRPFSGKGLFFDLGVTMGFSGLFVFFLTIATYIGSVGYFIVRYRESLWKTIILFSIVWVILPVILFVEVNGYVLFLFFLFLGLTFVSTHKGSKQGLIQEKIVPLYVNPQYSVSVVIVVLCVILGIGIFFNRIYKISLAGIYAQQAKTTSNMKEYLQRATETAPWESEYFRQLAEVYVSDAINRMVSEERETPLLEADFNEAFSAGRYAKELAPQDVLVVASLARIYENVGTRVPEAFDLAKEEYKRARELAPNNPLFPYKEGLIIIRQVRSGEGKEQIAKERELRKAIVALEQSTKLVSRFSSAYFQLSLAYKELGDLSSAEEYVRKAVSLEPYDVDILIGFVEVIFEDESKREEVKNTLEKILRIDSENVGAYLYLGQWYGREGNISLAKESYENAKRYLGKDQEKLGTYIDGALSQLDGTGSLPVEDNTLKREEDGNRDDNSIVKGAENGEFDRRREKEEIRREDREEKNGEESD